MGTAKIGDREVVHEAVPAEDKMQAFLWRHLLPAETLPALVFDPSYQPPADRIRPPIRVSAVTVFAIRKDGFDGPIKLSFKNLPKGLESPGATLGAKQEVVGLALKTSLTAMEKPVNVTIVGTAKIGDREIVHEAVPAEDKMQAFLCAICCLRKPCRPWSSIHPTNHQPIAFARRSVTRIDRRV